MTEPFRVEICLSGPGGACTKAEVKPNNYSQPGDRGNCVGLVCPKTSPNHNSPNNEPETYEEELFSYLDSVQPSEIREESQRLLQELDAANEAGDYEGATEIKNALWGLREKAVNAGMGAQDVPELAALSLATGAKITAATVGLARPGMGRRGNSGGRSLGPAPKQPPKAQEPSRESIGGYVKQKVKSLREQYLGRTPGKNSRTGKEVQDRMRKEGTLRDGRDGPEFKASDGEWYPIQDADMAHKTDAVTWWNETGRQYGAKAPEVRDWMLNSNNYVLDHYSINRSAGARLGETYRPPLK